ncbi:MAG: glycoside hydrolase family 36 protein [candidate division WOR-3 bacterium]|nr:glycoside hydrolase family 36 protein [candidate division WOR-3 bacterium]
MELKDLREGVNPLEGKKFNFEVPVRDLTTILTSYGWKRLPWRHEFETGPHKGIPLVLFLSRDEKVRFAVGLIEQDIPLKMKIDLDEENGRYNIEMNLKSRLKIHIYKTEDRGSWLDTIQEYRKAVGINPPNFSEEAYEPVFCSWYGIHHSVNQNWCLRNAKIAKELGLTTFIIDDGWFFDEKGKWGSYAQTGDWIVSKKKFPQMSKLAIELRDMDMRLLLWISPFMVGKESRAFKRLQPYLIGKESYGVRWLSPAKKKALTYTLGKMDSLYKENKLDGFKIDFVDALPDGDGLLDFYKGLQGLGRNLLFEFRQNYANLFGLQVGAVYRGLDTPLDFEKNLENCILLRAFTPDVPIHTDYIYWHQDEKLENMAKHMIFSVFFVPTISMDLEKLTEEGKNIIREWIRFHREHRNILFGDFDASIDGSYLGARKGKKAIYALFKPIPLAFKNLKELHILNGTEKEKIYLDIPENLKFLEVYKRDFSLQSKGEFSNPVRVEQGGFVKIKEVM